MAENEMACANTFRVIAAPHPLAAGAVCSDFGTGTTLADVVQDASHSLRVQIGGLDVPRALWAKVKPKAGQLVHITAFPQGGGNSGKWIRIAALVALSVLTYGIADGYIAGAYTGAVAGSATLGSVALSAGVMMMGQLAITPMVPEPKP